MKERIFALLLALTMITGLMPQNMMVAKAAAGDSVEVEIQVVDSYDQSELSQFEVSFQKEGDAQAPVKIDEETEKDLDSGKYIVKLDDGAKYKYTATADGYTEQTKDITVEENKPLTIAMDLEPIQVRKDSLALKVGQTAEMEVVNPVKGAKYRWNTDDPSVATVSGGTVTAEGEGNTYINVLYKDETTKIPVTVSQYETKVELSANPEKGKDVTEVKLTAKVTEGTTNVDEGSVTFKMGDSVLETSNVTNGEATYTYRTDTGQYLNGEVTFTATYNGTGKYATSNDTAVQTYASTEDIEVTASDEVKDGKIVFNGPNSSTTFKLTVSQDNGRKIIYESNTDVATVNETNGEVIVTVLEPGDIEIQVTAEATDAYNTSTYTFKAIAQQKVTLGDLDWQPVSKVYDRNGDISIMGSVPTDLQVGDKTASYEFSGSFDDVNVGTKKDITLEELTKTTGDGDYYSLEWSDNYKVTGQGTITAREVNLDIAKDVRLSYGQDLKSIVENGTYSAVTDLVQVEQASDERGFIAGDSEAYTFAATLVELAEGQDYYVNTQNGYANAVIPGTVTYDNGTGKISDKVTSTGEKIGNYKFIAKTAKTLYVEPQKISDTDILKAIKWIPNSTTLGVDSEGNALEENSIIDKIYAKDRSLLQLQLKSDSPFAEYYDKVFIQLPNEEFQDATTAGILLPQDMTEGALSGVRIRLVNSADDDTVTLDANGNEGNAFEHIYVDNSAPTVEFGDLTATAQSTLWDNLTFGFFKNGSWTQAVEVTEKPDKDNAGYADSAVESYVWKLTEKDTNTGDEKDDYESVKAKDLSADAVKAKIASVTDNNEWKQIENGMIPVSGNEAAIEEGYYVLFVRVFDKIGNGEVYVSNGMVFDAEAPVVTVAGLDDGIYGEDKISTENSSEGIEYTINIADPVDYTSAINRLEVKVTKTESGEESETVESTNEIYNKDTVYVDSYAVDFSQDSYELSDFADWKDLTVKGIITAKEGVSTDVKVEVIAYDNAGNSLKNTEGEEIWITKTFQIDRKAPEINVSFNNNSVKNEKYFNDDRIMTIDYTERNLDVDCLKFDLSIDGVDYGILTLDEVIENGQNNGSIIEVVSGNADNPLEVKNEGTDEQISTLKLKFSHDKTKSDDAIYSIVPSCIDKAGNDNNPLTYTDGTKAGDSFVIDKKAPELSAETVSYVNEKGNFEPKDSLLEDGQKAYSASTVEATIQITEKNFCLETGEFSDDTQFDFSATVGTDVNGESVTISDYLAIANSGDNWSSENFVRTSNADTFVFESDAHYVFTFTYTDLAGNSATYDPHYFTVDQTAPGGDIELDGSRDIGLVDFLNMITFNIFKNDTYDVGLTGDDATSGVKSIEYIIPEKAYGSEDEVAAVSKWNVSAQGNPRGGNAELNGSFTVSPNRQFVVYEKITDYAGNVTYRYPSNGIIADNELPQISITELNKGDSRNGIYNEDIHLRITAEDPIAGDTYSGLEHVWYTVTVAGNTSYSETIHLLDLRENDAEKYQAPEKRTFTKDITIPASANYNSNDIKVQAFVTDFSQNTEESDVMSLKMDITDPTIDVTYDLNSPLNDRYYNATRTATVTVTERNFDPSAVRFNITNTDGTQPSISGWSHSSDSGVSDSATHTCTVTFAADGDYTFTLNTTDLAGNDSNYTRVDDFTIDQTDPTIQVSYDNNNDAEPGYFNADRTATITVTEHNFNAAEVNTAITASLEGRGVATPGLGGWSTRGDVHTASVTFSADADYTFDVDYTDLAGNAAADYEQDSFTVDQTAPELEFFDIEDKSANNDVVAPGVRYSDNNYTESGVELTLKGANNGTMDIDGEHTSIPNGESIKMADFERTKKNDDLYTMTAVITDRAGNETEDSVIFSVNRFGSVYIISDATKEWLKTEEGEYTYINEEQEIQVTEINVDSIVASDISYGRDGQIEKLEEGKDYEVKGSGSEVSWKQYDYTINKENFETEGNYTVTIDSEDRATNVGNSKAKGCDIEFTVDKTAPTLVITGIEDGEAYREDTRNVTIDVADNYVMDNVVVSSDITGNSQEYGLEEIRQADGKLVYTMQSANDEQSLKAVATDAAGNTTETEKIGVLVTANLLVQYINNTPLFVGSIIGVVVIAGGLLWFFLIFKRKKDEEQANK